MSTDPSATGCIVRWFILEKMGGKRNKDHFSLQIALVRVCTQAPYRQAYRQQAVLEATRNLLSLGTKIVAVGKRLKLADILQQGWDV